MASGVIAEPAALATALKSVTGVVDHGLHIAKQIAEKAKTAAVDTDEVAEEHPVLIFGMTPAGRLAAHHIHQALSARGTQADIGGLGVRQSGVGGHGVLL